MRQNQDAHVLENNWRKTTLGCVADFMSGGTPSKSRPDYWDGSIPWVSAKDMKRLRLHDTVDKVTAAGLANGTKEVPANTVMILVRGMTLLNDVPVCITQRPMTFNQDVKALRPKSGITEAFLPYLILGLKDRLLALVDLAGHGTGRLNTDEVKAFEIDLPPLSEQQAIAHILGTLDDKIELNRRMNQTLEEMARALFKSWFVDFDPVRAKIALKKQGLGHHTTLEAEPSSNDATSAGEWTVERARTYLDAMDPQIANLFPDRLVGSELGQIPDGWDLAGFSDVVTQLRENENPLASPETVYCHYSIPAYDDGQTPKRELGEGIKSVKTRVTSGTVLLSKLNPEIERVWLPDITDNDRAVCSTEFLVLRPEPPFDRSFAYCLMRSTPFRERLEALVTGTSKSHQRTPVRAVLALEVLNPPAPILHAFQTNASVHLNQTMFFRRELSTLTSIRDTLLTRLVSGELQAEKSSQYIIS